MDESKQGLIRSFIAIEFSEGVVKEVARVQEALSHMKFHGKMTELENLHLSLKFLGEIEPAKVEKVREILRTIKFEGFEAKLGDIGIFHMKGDPRIVWIKILGKGIYDLQAKIDETLEKERLFLREERFMSHLTIARIKYVKDKKGFENYVRNISVRDLKLKVESFVLKRSELKESGPVYTTLEEFALK